MNFCISSELERDSSKIYKAITEKEPTIPMDDYILKYFFCKYEKQKLETVSKNYDLIRINIEEPTIITSYNKMIIDFLISDEYLKTLLVGCHILVIDQ